MKKNRRWVGTRQTTRAATDLLGGALGVHHVHVEAVERQFAEQVLGPILGLQEEQHGRPDALLDQLPDGEHFALLPPDKDEFLVDRRRACVFDAHGERHRVAEEARGEFAHRRPQRGTEQRALQARRGVAFAAFPTFPSFAGTGGGGSGRTFGQDFVDLAQKRRRRDPVVVVVVAFAFVVTALPLLSPAPARLQLEQLVCAMRGWGGVTHVILRLARLSPLLASGFWLLASGFWLLASRHPGLSRLVTCLVEDDDLDAGQVNGALAQQRDEAQGRGHQQVDGAQRVLPGRKE